MAQRVIIEDFHGWSLTALWDDLKFDAKHYSDIERRACVGSNDWDKNITALFKPFTKATVKYFDSTELEEARAWLRS